MLNRWCHEETRLTHVHFHELNHVRSFWTRVDFWFCCMTTWYQTKNDCEHLWLTDAAELIHDEWSNLGPFTVAEGQIRPSKQDNFNTFNKKPDVFLKLPLTKKWPREQDPCSEHGSDWELAGKSLDYTMIKVNSRGSPCRCQQKWKQSTGRHKARVSSILPRRYLFPLFPKKISLSPKQTYTLTYTNSHTHTQTFRTISCCV